MTIELVNITKRYGSTVVLNGITQKIEDGEFFVVLGPSGAGKTTLLKVIAGIERPDSGKIIVDGKDITNLPPEKRNIAMVFQSYALYPNMNVHDNMAFPLKMRHYPKDEIERRVQQVAKLLNITDILYKNVTQISGGQQQRVALARAIVRDPAFFLLDEPLSSLDARMRAIARGELKRIHMELKKTFVYVTHDQKEAMSMATRIAVLHNGVFEQVGTPLELYERPTTKWVAQFIGDHPMNFLPGEVVGNEGFEVGFRPDWVEVGRGNLKCQVYSLEVVGELRYLMCDYGESSIILLSREPYNVGDTVAFEVTRYNLYRDGRLVER